MTDRHINQDETQIYGAHTSTKIRSLVVGLVPVFDPALQHLATEIDNATTAVATAVSSARGTDTVLRKGVKDKSAALASAIGVLGRFSKHLGTHKADTLDRKAFFPADGTAKGAGTTPPRGLLALEHLVTGRLTGINQGGEGSNAERSMSRPRYASSSSFPSSNSAPTLISISPNGSARTLSPLSVATARR